MSENVLEIQVSKGKILRMILFSICFIGIGIWMIAYNPQTGNPIINSTAVKFTSAFLSVSLGILGFVFFMRKWMDKRPVLIFDKQGITDNSSAIAAGFIPWSDINHVSEKKVSGQYFVLIEVSNPETYIDRQSSTWKKKAMSTNWKRYGSPIFFSPNIMDISFSDLVKEIKLRLENNQH